MSVIGDIVSKNVNKAMSDTKAGSKDLVNSIESSFKALDDAMQDARDTIEGKKKQKKSKEPRFCIGKEFSSLIAVVAGTRYTLSNVELAYSIGGTATGTMTVTGLPAPNTVKTIDIDTQDPFSDRLLDNLAKVEIQLVSSGSPETLFTGFILGRVTQVGIGAASFSVGATYKISNKLALLDRPPLGSFYRLSPSENTDPKGGLKFVLNRNNLQGLLSYNESAKLFQDAKSSGGLNIAKFIASILDSTFAGGDTSAVGTVLPATSISECISNLEKAPAIQISADVNKSTSFITHIIRSISSLYGVASAINIFKKLLSVFYLTLVPDSEGNAKVIVDNAFSKNVNTEFLPSDLQQYRCDYYNNYRDDIGCIIADASRCLTDRGSAAPADNGIVEASAFCLEQMTATGPIRKEGKLQGFKSLNGDELKAKIGNTNTKFYRVDVPRVLVDIFVKEGGTYSLGDLALFTARNAYATINRANSMLYVTLVTSLFTLEELIENIGKVASILYSDFGDVYFGRLASIRYNISCENNGFKQKLVLIYTNARTDKEQSNLSVMNPFYKDSDQ